ncbi:MAG TPA: HAD family hydrolase [Acidobacteriaceae bacterium]|jgi:putative hydrolase of the HAD superfamily
MPRFHSHSRQTLLVDADDTLWENNVYFERAIAAFISYLDHHQHAPAEVRQVLNRCEHTTIKAHGYGMASFERSLLDCYEQLTDAPPSDEQRTRIASFASSIANQAIELLPGVAETLPRLAERHLLILVTKGNAREQQQKLDRSGIHMHFAAVEIPPEKHPDAYREIMTRHALTPATTWMIGNSPRSDINPALAAGLHAVYLHHPNTWVLEHDSLARPVPPQQLLRLDRFAALTDYF